MKKVFKAHRARRERGMALLFALGFLALMLILGLGFVTTSLLAQKLAANNGNRAQARMLARSAAARAMLNIVLYNDQAILNGKSIEDYDSICSYDKVTVNDNGTASADTAVTDQLRQVNDSDGKAIVNSKLNYQIGTEDYTGEKSQAQWLYFYDSPNSVADGRRIIGRAAFQVLPRQAGRLSLYAITGGSKVENDYGAYPHSYRWGRDIAELDLTHTKTLPNWYDTSSLTVNTIPFKYETLYTSYGNFFTSDEDVKKKWIEYWFAEGKNPILKDAFAKPDPSDSKGEKVLYYNRFNISDFYYDAAARGNAANDNWYDRFKSGDESSNRTKGWDAVTDARKNSPEALEKLAGEAVEYKESHTTDPDVDPSGLPFLKRIGNHKWSFESIDHLRRQIAANFNDYCDADSIPTSDKPKWSVTESDKYPNYTGNEKTLYVNEIAAELGPIKLTYDKDSYAIQVKEDDLKFKLWVELVNMYDNADAASSQLLDPANLEVETGLGAMTFTYSLNRVEYTGTVKFSYKDKNGRLKTNGTAHFTATVNVDVPIKYDGAGSIVIGGDKFSSLTDGYSVGNGELALTVTNPDPGTTFTDPVKAAAEQAAKARLKTGESLVENSIKITISQVDVRDQLKADNAKFQLEPVLLRANKNISVDGKVVCPKDTGVDFVRFDRVGAMTFSRTPGEDNISLNLNQANDRNTYFIGGLEARDPRQNLNPRYSAGAPVESSDWKIDVKLMSVGDAASELAPSFNFERSESSGRATYKVVGGKINKVGNPKIDENGNPRGENVADKETAEDPAWLGDNNGQHVSTAYIRNAPMVSPWEIGIIHRAREWQTLNIKRAGSFEGSGGAGAGSSNTIRFADIDSSYGDPGTLWNEETGTSYENGDGGILEFIKVGTNCRCMGKIPLTLLRPNANDVDPDYNKDVIKMLFDGIRKGQTMKQFYAETKFDAPTEQGGTPITVDSGDITDCVNEIDRLCNLSGDKKFRMRSQFLNSEYGDLNGKYTFEMAQMDNDAQREELIGKTINLLTVNEVTPPNIFRVLVVAQSIRDVGGIASAADLSDSNKGVTMSKIHKRNKKTLKCLLGRFDYISDSGTWENNTYFDEITGEVRALVTIERVPATDDSGNANKEFGRMVVTGIEFID